MTSSKRKKEDKLQKLDAGRASNFDNVARAWAKQSSISSAKKDKLPSSEDRAFFTTAACSSIRSVYLGIPKALCCQLQTAHIILTSNNQNKNYKSCVD